MGEPYVSAYSNPAKENADAITRDKLHQSYVRGLLRAQGERPPINTPGSGQISENNAGRAPGWDGILPLTTQSNPGISKLANVPPMTNFLPGQSGANSLADHVTVTPRAIPNPLTGPMGNAASDRANLRQNMAMYAPGGLSRRQPSSAAVAARQPDQSSPGSSSIQEMLDRVPGTSPVASAGQSQVTPYGAASSRFASPNEIAAGPATPIMENGVQIGVGHTPFDVGAARRATLAAHPEIGQAGTAANQAFVAHAQQYGEPSAHSNIESIVAGGTALNPNGNNEDTAIPSGGIPAVKPLQATGASPAIAHNDINTITGLPAGQAQQPEPPAIRPNSILGAAGTTEGATPVRDFIDSAMSSGAEGLGFSPNISRYAGPIVRAGLAPFAPATFNPMEAFPKANPVPDYVSKLQNVVPAYRQRVQDNQQTASAY